MYNVIHDILNEIRITNNINFVKANDNVTYPTNKKKNNICIHLKPTDTIHMVLYRVLFPGGCKFTHSCEKVMKPTKLSERKGGSF